MTRRKQRNDLAMERYGVYYNQLSAWTQQEIDKELPDEAPVVPNDLPFTLEVLSARIAKLEMENVEIWQENAQLRLDLARLQDEIQELS